ncbi:ATP phosphoribosyltransferase regulatory subunit [Clostridium sartagoforme]|uniref:ATP phosphoribosyltransferase regulatory subunit n=1 Tax=Clostridium sartagoforme TaxID=84031 RepID=A0A4S2DLW1_9CLOT|nr:ATP phosphoribosyltransferase regulatory subunit [Clostridium sartagoforme]TGY42672.1 ATP phosphoribosyltransferase regulatory subunit [Clostridium sartagoforme]
MNKNIIPEGTRDLTNEECLKKARAIKSINNVFNSWGYKEAITPSIEFYEGFRYEYSGLKEESVYKFFDSKGRILALRPDMTIPIVRLVSTRFKDVEETIKIRYEATIYRVFEEFSGRRNEYTDCGIELINKENEFADLEALIIAIEALKATGAKNFKIEIGEVNFFKAAIEALDIAEKDKLSLSILIEKKKIEELKKFLKRLDVEDNIKKTFYKLPLLFGEGVEILEKYKELAFNTKMINCINYLENIYKRLEALGYEEYITFDLSITPRLNFYTGIIFRGYIEGSGGIVLSGGRYDDLIDSVKKGFKAIGFSINVDELSSILDLELPKEGKYIITFSKENEIEALKKSMELRKEGYVVEVIPSEELEGINLKKEDYYGG